MLPRALALLAALTALAGCGLGPGEERAGGATVRVTRDFGRELLASTVVEQVPEGRTVMWLLRYRRDVKTRFGGGFVQAIDGLAGDGPGGTQDWFYWVNGIEADRGAADYELSPGDRVQWDYRDWRETMTVRAIVGAFPEPFVHGLEGKRFPVRVECEDAESGPCETVKARLRDLDVPATGASLGATGNQNVIRVVVATWQRARELPSARALDAGPRRSGVFARFAAGGRALELLDLDGERVRSAGPDTGLVAALRPTDEEIVWLVTGGDARGVENAAEAFDVDSLRDAFAVAAPPSGAVKLPLKEAP